jgi:hypothetical protein
MKEQTMKSRSEINRQLGFANTNARLAQLYAVLGLLAVLSLTGVMSHSASAGLEPAFPQGLNPEQVAGTIKANAQALKAFSYQQRMQLQLKGETKKVTLSQMSHDMYGNEQKTLLSEQPSADSSQQQPSGGRGGRLKQRVVAKKTGEFKDMMNEIAALVKSYTELPPQQLQASLKQAAFSPGEGDMAGSVQIVMHNVIQTGDSMTIWIDRTAMLYRRAVIATTYEGNPVTTTANYAMLPSGQVYMAQAILNYPKKEVVVEIDNSNYQR